MKNSNQKMKNIFYFSLIIISFTSCDSKKCFTIREWEVNTVGNKSIYKDTMGLSIEPISYNILDSALDISNSANFNYNKSIFNIEAMKFIDFDHDSLKVFRILKDGNLTFYYTKQFGVLMSFSRLKRLELIKVESNCSKQFRNIHPLVESIKHDSILTPQLKPIFRN